MHVWENAGPLVHARITLGDEPILWAGECPTLRFDMRGIDEYGKPKHSLLFRAAAAVVDATSDVPDEHHSERADVMVFGRNGKCAAMRHAREIIAGDSSDWTVWALTPRRVHVVRRSSMTPEQKKMGLLRGLVSSFTDNGPKTVTVFPTTPLVDIPRADIVGFEIATRENEPCLRMRLADDSGFDLKFFRTGPGYDSEPDQYRRLLALSMGRTDPWM
ncbi:hypothetical protein [Actinokineospora enzanensis]|uniref:hypothetical protein n=1 Tax=Actinokineospora enzanensis TaxID=155975 RepID=UPI00036721AA|nr:hypothetical protein [Actinokineospora enzanensis]